MLLLPTVAKRNKVGVAAVTQHSHITVHKRLSNGSNVERGHTQTVGSLTSLIP